MWKLYPNAEIDTELPHDHITAWREQAPWVQDSPVEQDLVISRALVEIFSHPVLKDALALRGGTALNKLYIRPAAGYSEDPRGCLLIGGGTWISRHLSASGLYESDSMQLRRSVSLIWLPFERWRINLTARYVGSRLITSIPTGDVDASGYAILGATATYERSTRGTFCVALHNAFDEGYQDAPGFPSPGLRLRVGANLAF